MAINIVEFWTLATGMGFGGASFLKLRDYHVYKSQGLEADLDFYVSAGLATVAVLLCAAVLASYINRHRA